jgi:hypothetical protein
VQKFIEFLQDISVDTVIFFQDLSFCHVLSAKKCVKTLMLFNGVKNE